jgi:hypothetical protein
MIQIKIRPKEKRIRPKINSLIFSRQISNLKQHKSQWPIRIAPIKRMSMLKEDRNISHRPFFI